MTDDRLIYFAGSIRGGRDDRALYHEIIECLGKYGSVLTEHVADVNLGGEGETLNDRQIFKRDIDWLMKSDCLVAEVTTPSLGVGFEIGKASEWGKPILCLHRLTEGRSLSAMIAGCNDLIVREYRSSVEVKRIVDDYFLDNKLLSPAWPKS